VPRFVGILSIIILVIWVVTLYALRPEPLLAVGLVFPTLTSVFVTSSSIVVTYVAAKAYARGRLLNVLFLGCGALVLGCTSLLAAMFLGSLGENFSSTVFGTGAVLSSVFSFACAALTYRGSAPRFGGGAMVWISLTLAAVVLLAIAPIEGLLPLFYVAGMGTTVLDHIVLGAATLTFAASAALIFFVYSSSKSIVLLWYSMALGATALGLVGIAVANGDLGAISMRAGWATVYLGGVLLVTSVFSAERLIGLSKRKRG
jgi:hypothetical protein